MNSQWSIEPVFESPLIVMSIIGVLLALLLVRPSFGNPSRTQNRILTGLRLVAILMLLLAMIRPTLVSYDKKPQSAVMLVMIDKSLSMNHPSGQGMTRWEHQLSVLQQAEQQLADLSQVLDIRFVSYDKAIYALEFKDGKIQFPEKPDGLETDIGSSLFEAVQRELGNRLACVLLLGDGAQTAFDPKVEVHDAGRELARLGTPLYTLAFGRSDAGRQSKDVAVERLPQDYSTYVKNELRVKGLIRIRGFVNQNIPVRLEVVSETGEKEEFGPVMVRVRKSGELVPAEITYVPKKPGRYTLTMRAETQPDESVNENNQLTAFLTVREGGLKVLYLFGGSLVGEQQELRRTITAAPDMELDAEWISLKSRASWPANRADMFEDLSYDVFIIEDLPAVALGQPGMKALAKAVESGKSLMMIGGYHSFGPGRYYDTPIGNLLPIKIDRTEAQSLDVSSTIRRSLHLPEKMQIKLVPTKSHSITTLAAASKNNEVWSRLPALRGANKFVGVKSRARVLLETPDGTPILVAGDYGKGRTLAFAGNTTWRWRRRGFEKPLRRFWRQSILWLAKREDNNDDEVWIDLEQRRLRARVPMAFKVGARAATGDALVDARFAAELIQPDGKSRSILLTEDEEAWSGRLEDLETPGEYELKVEGTLNGKSIGRNAAKFFVIDQQPERTNPAADPEQFDRLAGMTKDAGGKRISPEGLVPLLRQLQEQPPELQVDVANKWQLGQSPTDGWIFFLLVVAVLSIEWFLRKKWGMV